MSSGIMETAVQSQMEMPEEFSFEEKLAIRIHYNWRQVQYDDEAGEDYEVAEVGKIDTLFQKEVVEIKSYEAAQHPFCIITFKDGYEAKVYNLNVVLKKK